MYRTVGQALGLPTFKKKKTFTLWMRERQTLILIISTKLGKHTHKKEMYFSTRGNRPTPNNLRRLQNRSPENTKIPNKYMQD